MQIWEMNYETTHFKNPVFRAFAEEKFTPNLQQGATFNREYASDLVVNAMSAAGGYSVQGFTNVIDIGTVDTKEETSVRVVEWQKLEDHLPTQMKYTKKAANALWLQVDANVLYAIQQNAASYIDDGVINGAAGTTGKPVALAVQTIQQFFSAGIQQLQLLNVEYEPNKILAKDVKLETISNATVAAISPQVYNLILQYVGGKTTLLGDNITRNGHIGMLFGFNLFVSNNLTWEGVLNLTTKPTDGDTITLNYGVTAIGVDQSVTFTFKDTIGSTAGQVKICSTAAKTVTNLVTAMTAPYTAISDTSDTGFYPFTQASETTAQQKLLYNLKPVQTAVATLGGATGTSSTYTYLDLFVKGAGNVPVSSSLTATNNGWGYQCQHNILGTSKSVSLLMLASPHLYLNPVSSAVAKDLVCWNLYGIKVFNDQSFQLIDGKVDSSAFLAAGTPVNTFN